MSQAKLQSADIPDPHNLAGDVIISRDTLREHRIPPRQSRTLKWPVLDAGGPPSIDLNRWKLVVKGLVENTRSWNWEEFLPQDKPGYWEQGGYHMNGDPWKEERFRSR